MTIHILILSMASITLFMLSGTGDAAVISVSPNQSIQAAVDCARAGDTIEVLGGYYRENVNITSPLVLRGRGGPVVDAGGEGCAITLFAGGITVEGFIATNSSSDQAGISVSNLSSANLIRDNIIVENWGDGLDLWASRDNQIVGNAISKNGGNGIGLWSSEANEIQGNALTENGGSGIFGGCVNSSITGNNLSLNRCSGMAIVNSNDNRIAENLALRNGESGFALILCSGNLIQGNNASVSALSGISLLFSWNNTIANNTMQANPVGLYLGNSSDQNEIAGNEIVSNKLGVNIGGSGRNVIHHNCFEANTYYSYDDGQNLWDDGAEGNYYQGFTCIDQDSDGVCDQSLAVPGGRSVDRHPLASSSSGFIDHITLAWRKR